MPEPATPLALFRPDTIREMVLRAARWLTVTVAVGGLLAGCGGPPSLVTSGRRPAGRFACKYDSRTEAFTGAYGTASTIGWLGNDQAVVTCLGGSFYVQNGIDRNFGFGVYTGSPTAWTDLEGYLPAQVTTFSSDGARISITEFADKVAITSHAFVVAYCRIAVTNPGDHPLIVDPEPSAGLVVLKRAPNLVTAHATVNHDYVVAVDRFGNTYPWPTPQNLVAAGGFDRHLAHMSKFWNGQLAQIASIDVPDAALVDAYKSGFIYTQIARSGNRLDTGVNGYEMEYNHDVVGILANLFTQGYFSDARALLLEARSVIGSEGGLYPDGTWTYAWPWAIYLLKTGDLSFVRANFATGGPEGFSQPSIEATAHAIATDRTGPGGIMEMTDDLDSEGFWTVDDFEALMGLTAYRYIASRLGVETEVQWATNEYDSLLAATNSELDATFDQYGLDYLPCSMVQPNSSNLCANPENANWAATLQFGKWAWDGQLFGDAVSGPGISLIDATYQYGFGRLRGTLPANTFGGFPSDYYYSTGYNAAYGTWALAGQDDRDQGIMSYQFMIQQDQSGPNSWWESSLPPDPSSPWTGSHPGGGQGSSPHAWGMAEANKVLLDSLVAQESDGSVIVGRGVPTQWLSTGNVISVANFPTDDGHRLDVSIQTSGQHVSLELTDGSPPGSVLFELPDFVNNIAEASAGVVDEATGTVTLPAAVQEVTVQLSKPPSPA